MTCCDPELFSQRPLRQRKLLAFLLQQSPEAVLLAPTSHSISGAS